MSHQRILPGVPPPRRGASPRHVSPAPCYHPGLPAPPEQCPCPPPEPLASHDRRPPAAQPPRGHAVLPREHRRQRLHGQGILLPEAAPGAAFHPPRSGPAEAAAAPRRRHGVRRRTRRRRLRTPADRIQNPGRSGVQPPDRAESGQVVRLARPPPPSGAPGAGGWIHPSPNAGGGGGADLPASANRLLRLPVVHPRNDAEGDRAARAQAVQQNPCPKRVEAPQQDADG
mmetsp:Transcript_9691/g.18117  ORF Transcript_9691/g.18117 Transcript_9691/m.18117 type:complete len:228 (+) Transcript_9691:774-1457(+)